MKKEKILAIDDNADALYALERTLAHAGFSVLALPSGVGAIEKASDYRPDLILLDVMMPEKDGYQVLRDFKSDAQLRYVPVFLVTAKDSLHDLVTGLDSGADGYITKPFRPQELLARVEAALRMRGLYLELASKDAENKELRSQLEGETSFIGASQSIEEIRQTVKKVSRSDVSVLVLGASGTGKELIARAIHFSSERRNAKLIAKNCAAFSSQLIESELFGHRKGAFTGAAADKIGLIEAANNGTLFLDEIGEMPLDLQAKLLRVLEEGAVMPVGDNQERKVNTRIVAATNRDLKEMVHNGKFREDLYYRLNMVSIRLPELKERSGDIADIANYFAGIFAPKYGSSFTTLPAEITDALQQYDWPGNIRELRNEVERLYLFAEPGEALTSDMLSEHVLASNSGELGSESDDGSLRQAIEDIEVKFIRESLTRLGGNKSQVAKELGISRGNLLAKIKQYNLG